ncbi:MAG TPA: hypothetical protein PKC62_04325 [Ferruginibacter sp.]|jgi:hypothetical protein|nr:hypothetical protein [Bacteroidota bacterium]HMT95893.1 hypothetical protein [Ferruginibacter sp.]HMU24039.1 hypothetical protein [Ferruginibacter sp.]
MAKDFKKCFEMPYSKGFHRIKQLLNTSVLRQQSAEKPASTQFLAFPENNILVKKNFVELKFHLYLPHYKIFLKKLS